MRRLLRSLAIAALVGLPVAVGSAAPKSSTHKSSTHKSGGDCWPSALQNLRASSPDGYAIYKQVSDPGYFKGWTRCDDAQFDLSTAVHESTHFVTSEIDAFPLVGGGTIKLPHEVSKFYPPTRIAKQFKTDDFTTIYLRLGKASFLLDELNAYSHDLATAVDLEDLASPDEAVDHRDGLAALMAFVAVYAETAKESEPATWRGLREPEVAGAVAGLWGQAERVMAASCGIPNFGTADKAYIRRFCAAKARSALEPILGRAPLCPTACLQPEIEVGETSGSGADGDEKPPHRSIAGPSWIETIIKSRETARDPEPGEASTGDETR